MNKIYKIKIYKKKVVEKKNLIEYFQLFYKERMYLMIKNYIINIKSESKKLFSFVRKINSFQNIEYS